MSKFTVASVNAACLSGGYDFWDAQTYRIALRTPLKRRFEKTGINRVDIEKPGLLRVREMSNG